METTLLANYNPTTYGKIPYFDEQVHKLENINISNIMQRVGPIFLKHDVHKEFALIVVHRHFDLTDEEILVDFDSSDGAISVALPWKYDQSGKVVKGPVNWDHFKSHGFQYDGMAGVDVQPMTWVFDSDGEIHPFEFQMGKVDEVYQYPQSEFVDALFRTLLDLGVLNMFGLRRYSEKFWETTNDEMRANIAHYGDTPIPPELVGPMKMVMWTFNRNDHGTVEGICVGHCGHTCCAHGGGSSCGCK